MALSSAFTFLAQATAPSAAAPAAATDATAGQAQGGPPFILIAYGLMFAAMYFFMIKPQRDKQKAHEKMLAALQPGEEVVTTGGIYGVITSVKDDRFVVRISESTKVEIAKGFITSVVKPSSAGDKK